MATPQKQIDTDHELAMTLAHLTQEDYYEYERSIFTAVPLVPAALGAGAPSASVLPPRALGPAYTAYTSPGGTVASPRPNPMRATEISPVVFAKGSGPIGFYPLPLQLNGQGGEGHFDPHSTQVLMRRPEPTAAAAGGGGGWMDDLSLARALQSMEFEIDTEMRRMEGINDDFNGKEYRASRSFYDNRIRVLTILR